MKRFSVAIKKLKILSNKTVILNKAFAVQITVIMDIIYAIKCYFAMLSGISAV